MSEMRAAVLLLVGILLASLMSQINSENARPGLSRRRRYVAFPEGATLSVAICMTTQATVQPREIFTQGINWGISYDLPNNTAIFTGFKTPGGLVAKRRSRRDLYQKMELIIDSMGYNGKDCIFKALCETGAWFNHRSEDLLQEILRIVFSFPTQAILSNESDHHSDYKDAHIFGRHSRDPGECTVKYSKCRISLIDLAMGYYTENIPSL